MRFNLLSIFSRLESRYKYALSSAFFVALFSQGMGLFNKFSVHDDVKNYGIGATYTSGRWMLDLLGKLENIYFGDGHYSLSTFNGFISIILIAFSACLVIRILDIKSRFFCMFISGIMVCFPVITSLFGFMFTFHFYMISLFLGVLGAYYICALNKWYFWMAGIILITASVGIYQAFIPFIISLVLMSCIKNVLTYHDVRLFFKKLFFSGAGCISFLLLYLMINNLFLSYLNVTLSDYMGISSMGQNSIRGYLSKAIEAYVHFFKPDTKAAYFMYPGAILYLYYAVIGISIILCAITAFRLAKHHIVNSILFVILFLLFPLCTNFIFVMTERKTVHSLMVYAQLLPFVLFAFLMEHTDFKNKITKNIFSNVSIIIAVSLLLMYARVDNKCYIKATYAQQESISYLTTLVTLIKGTDGYKDEMPVAFINEKHLSDTSFKVGNYGAFRSITYVPYNMDAPEYVNNYRWKLFMSQWLGFAPTIANAESFSGMAEVEQMPSYPDDGSIRIINDTVVVKF